MIINTVNMDTKLVLSKNKSSSNTYIKIIINHDSLFIYIFCAKKWMTNPEMSL